MIRLTDLKPSDFEYLFRYTNKYKLNIHKTIKNVYFFLKNEYTLCVWAQKPHFFYLKRLKSMDWKVSVCRFKHLSGILDFLIRIVCCRCAAGKCLIFWISSRIQSYKSPGNKVKDHRISINQAPYRSVYTIGVPILLHLKSGF